MSAQSDLIASAALAASTAQAMLAVRQALGGYPPAHQPLLVPSRRGEMSSEEVIEDLQHREKFMEATQDVQRQADDAEINRRLAAIQEAQRSNDRHRLAILAMFDQAFSTAQLERMALDVQWPLEYAAIDRATAARAIINACDRSIEEATALIALRADSMDQAWRLQQLGFIELRRQIRDRWAQRVPTAAAK